MHLIGNYISFAVLANVALAVGVFVLDVLTPLGVPAWFLYFMPFLFMPHNPPRYYSLSLAGLCTILIFLGYILSPLGALEGVSGRGVVAIVLWVYAIVLTRRRSAYSGSEVDDG